MNFLGHCLLTQYNPEYISGNLAGDHFKGDLSQFKDIPEPIMKGVEIHRFIDFFTDSSNQIQAVAKIFQDGGVKRISYIASDIILDHYISQKWNSFSAHSLSTFIEAIYRLIEQDLIFFPDKFHYIFHNMKEKNWLSRYLSQDGIELTLYKFEQVIPFNNNLHDSFAIYLKNQTEIDEYYHSFLNEMMSTLNQKFKLNVTL